MTSEDVRAELERTPFIPIRIHMVSGNSVDLPTASDGWMLQNAILVLHPRSPSDPDTGYDVISLRNIERLEQVKGGFDLLQIMNRVQ